MRWLVFDVPVGHALFGKLQACPTCSADAQATYLQNMCGLRGEELTWTFASTKRSQANAEAYDTARALAQKPAYLYTLLGDYGVGKSRLLACLVNAGRAAGWVSIYTSTAGLLEYLRGAFDAGTALKYDDRWQTLTTATILAIDEFDRWNPTPWAREQFERLLDERYRAQGQLTAFAANCGLGELPPYVRSRMTDVRCYLFELTGQDVRRLRR